MSVLDADTLPLDGTQFIEASAGTGKTFTIATLFTRLVVERGFDVGEVLVVTYTEAAASELADRIRTRLRQAKDAAEARSAGRDAGDVAAPITALLDAAESQPGGLDEAHARLAVALHGFDERAISTIHGFCLRALQEHAFESGSAFDLELVGADRELLTDVAWDFWSKTLHDASPALIDALRSQYVGTERLGPERLGELIGRKSADPDMPILLAAEQGDLDAIAAEWSRRWREISEIWAREGEAIVELIFSGPLSGTYYKAKRFREQLPESMRRIDAAAVPGFKSDEAEKTFGLLRPSVMREKTKKPKKKGEVMEPPTHRFFDLVGELLDVHEQLEEARAGAVASVLRRAMEVGVAALADRKRVAGIQFFDDLLRDLADALRGEQGDALADRIGAQFPVALIDEFQDTDPIQYEIFSRVWIGDGRAVFLVGDPKQAIYGFRGADVFAYLRARRDSGARPHDLATNWRSDPGLIEAVNQLFGGAHRPFLFDEIEYRPVAPRPGSSDVFEPEGAADFAPFEILRLAERADGKPSNKGRAEKDAAHVVAEDIQRLVSAGVRLQEDGEERALIARDVAVLCRTHKQGRLMKKTLAEWGISSVEVGERSVFESGEAEELEWVLRGLTSANDLRRVRAALGTRLLGLDAEALIALDADPDGWDQWLGRFAEWRELWVADGVVVALEAIVASTSAFARILAEEGGERVVTNFEQLFELLHETGGRDRLGPESLLAWLTRQRLDPASRDHSAREQAKIRLESDADAVQIVTVHASKGLEYPVVYCPFLFDAAEPFGVDRSWVRFHDASSGGRMAMDLGSPEKPDHAEEANRELLAEHLRLLYVALTRAAHRCVVVWGRLGGNARQHRSALAYLLHQPRPPDEGASAVDWLEAVVERAKGIEAEELDDDLERVVERAPGVAIVRKVSPSAPTQRASGDRATEGLDALRIHRVLDARRRTSSFSGLVAGAHERAQGEGAAFAAVRDVAPRDEGVDHDRSDDVVRSEAEVEGARVALADFPAGAMVGTAVHAVFEHLDFARPVDDASLAIVHAQLDQGNVGSSHVSAFAEALPGMLEARLSSEPNAVRLADVERADRIDEMEFIVPVALDAASEGARGALTPSALADVFDRHAASDHVRSYAARLGALDFMPLEGFLKGYIDLLFRHGGRYHVVDYKSNHLGPRVEDYAPDRLVVPMLEHDYVLQYHLYVLALHRQLALRLPDYDYDTHVGEVYYLFLRGLSAAHPIGFGVYADRPPLALVEALSELLASPAAAKQGAA